MHAMHAYAWQADNKTVYQPKALDTKWAEVCELSWQGSLSAYIRISLVQAKFQ
jgi:hypothetical protein